ncbi:MAG TPA: hypothetical protein PLW65_34455, partial [Pseudomonadota bacterium]|nr:hypothetical protein [Pseudomonadota bacterium]
MSNGRHFTPPTPAYRPRDPFAPSEPRSAERIPSCEVTLPLPSRPRPVRVDNSARSEAASQPRPVLPAAPARPAAPPMPSHDAAPPPAPVSRSAAPAVKAAPAAPDGKSAVKPAVTAAELAAPAAPIVARSNTSPSPSRPEAAARPEAARPEAPRPEAAKLTTAKKPPAPAAPPSPAEHARPAVNAAPVSPALATEREQDPAAAPVAKYVAPPPPDKEIGRADVWTT